MCENVCSQVGKHTSLARTTSSVAVGVLLEDAKDAVRVMICPSCSPVEPQIVMDFVRLYTCTPQTKYKYSNC